MSRCTKVGFQMKGLSICSQGSCNTVFYLFMQARTHYVTLACQKIAQLGRSDTILKVPEVCLPSSTGIKGACHQLVCLSACLAV